MRYYYAIFIWLMCFTQVLTAENDHQVPLQNEGVASYYHSRFHGRKSASGHVHSREELTAAHRTLPFGTHLRVTNLSNDKSVIVRVADRGPFRRGRIIDVSEKAAEKLDFIKKGLTRVRIEVVPYSKEPLDMELLFPLSPIPMLSVSPARPEVGSELLSYE